MSGNGPSRESYDSMDDNVRDAFQEIMYAEHMGDVGRGLKRLALALGIPEPVYDPGGWGGTNLDWPWEIEADQADKGS